MKEIKEKLEGKEKEVARKLKDEEVEKRREETARKLKEAADKVKNEFFNPNSDLRSGRWFKRTFGF